MGTGTGAARSDGHGARWAARVAVVAAAILVGGCVPPPPEPTTVVTLPEGAEEVLAARDALGDAVVVVAEAVIAVAEGVDDVRHDVPRGAAQVEAATAVRAAASELREASTALADAATSLAGPRVALAAELANRLAVVGLTAAEEAAQDLDSLAPLLAFDQELDAAVASWGRRGSRSEQAAAFPALAEHAAALVDRARRLDAGLCPVLRTNRIRWADLVAARTAELRDLALQAEGGQFDDRRRAFARAPYGEDRAVADSETAPCWERRSPLPTLGAEARQLVAEISAALDG